jgi:hypothetical protein
MNEQKLEQEKASDTKRIVMQHGHEGHYFHCAYCGYVGEEKELPADPDGHECGKDECPECGMEGFITCCYESIEEAENSSVA